VWVVQSLAEYLAQADHKYTAESKVADLMTLKQFLRDRIESESKLVDMYTDGTSALLGSMKVTCSGVIQDPFSQWMESRNELLDAVIQYESVVKKIKIAFHQQNTNRPPHDRFTPPSSSEIRQKLRERSGAAAHRGHAHRFHLVCDIIADFRITASSIIHNSHLNEYFD
jgi:hypothetical protein